MTPVLALLRTSLTIYRKNAAFFGGYAAWLLLPLIAAGVFRFIDLGAATFPVGVAILAVNGIIWLWLFALMTRAADAIIRKRKIDQQAISHVAWQLLMPVAATIGLLVIAVLGGVILLVVPAFVFLVWFALSPVATALEGGTAIASFSKTREMVKGRFFPAAWRIIGGPFLILFGYAFFMSVLLLMLVPLTGIDPSQMEAVDPPVWLQLFDAVIQIFLMPWVMIYMTLVYRELGGKQEEKVTK